MKKILISVLLVLMLAASIQLVAAADVVPMIFFGFDDGEMPSELTPKSSSYTITDGILHGEVTESDPYLTYYAKLEADNYSKILVRIKHELTARNDGKSPVCQYYYTGIDKNGDTISLAEGNSKKIDSTLSTGGEYVVYELPIDHDKLDGAILSSIRFDIVSCPGSFWIDYIAIIPENLNKDVVFSFDSDGDTEGWGHSNLEAATSVKNGVLYGKTGASAQNGLVYKAFSTQYSGADFQNIYVRMRLDNQTGDGNALMYTDLRDESGNVIKSWSANYADESGNQYKFVSNSLAATNSGTYKLYNFDFSTKVPYINNYIKDVYFNVINKAAVDFYIDYIIFKNKNSYEWTFDYTDYRGGWTPGASGFSQSDGKLVYTAPSTYDNPRFSISGLSINSEDYVGLEVVMKHEFAASGTTAASDSSTIQMYYSGVDSSGTTFSMSEPNSASAIVSSYSSGDNYRYYYIDLAAKSTWNGKIKSLRIDPINSNGNVWIDYIRLVPSESAALSPLDESVMSVSYAFESEKAGEADGTITIDFASQDYENAKNITFYWASGNADNGYSALTDYSNIRAFIGTDFNGTYSINKNLMIPLGATALAAEIRDIDKTFTLYYDIPENKQAVSLGTPLYTVGLISDVHVGGWGSAIEPNPRLAAARTQLSELTDFVVMNGDITQWYGAYSGEEFTAYNFDGTSYKDNGVTSTEFLGIGNSQWTVLNSYLKGYTVPVYVVQGNHDIKDGDGWSDMLESEKYWKPFLSGWIDYSNTTENEQKYENYVTDSDTENYYDTEINGHHYIFLAIPKTQSPHYSYGEEQLAWLDKKLFEKEGTGKPIFVFGHVPLETELNGSYWDNQIGDDAEIKEILAKHPTAIYVSGHTHYSLNVDFLSSINGAQETPSYIHDGGTTTVNMPVYENNPDLTDEVYASHGVVAEVYKSGILLKGRDFVGEKWISRGYTYLTFKEECAVSEVSVTKTVLGSNVVLSASGTEENAVTWYLDGEVQEHSGSTITVASDFAGYVAIRVNDSNGGYISELFESIDEIEAAETGITSSALASEGVEVSFTVSTEDVFSKIFAAAYDGDGRLSSAVISGITAKDIELGSVTVNLDTDGASFVKIMILKGTDTLSPVCSNYTLNLR